MTELWPDGIHAVQGRRTAHQRRTCHTGDLSAGGPFLQRINGQPFATVPYRSTSTTSPAPASPAAPRPATSSSSSTSSTRSTRKGASRRRLMVISLHEQLSGHASRVRVLHRVSARRRDREDAIAQWILTHPRQRHLDRPRPGPHRRTSRPQPLTAVRSTGPNARVHAASSA